MKQEKQAKKRGRPRSQQHQQAAESDGYSDDPDQLGPEPQYDKIREGSNWTGLVWIDEVQGQVVAPQSISRDLEIVDNLIEGEEVNQLRSWSLLFDPNSYGTARETR